MHVLLIANDVVGERMAGPGIRFWELARVLSAHYHVALAIPPFLRLRDPVAAPDFPAEIHVCERSRELRRLVDRADVVITLGAVVLVYPFLARTGKPLVVDAYDPFLLAGLEQYRGEPPAKRRSVFETYRRAHRANLLAADFVLCASETQRDYWLGMLSALGRVNPSTHEDDPTLRRLIDVVPFGLPETPPQHSGSVLKGVHPKIAPDDKVVLWGGGLWSWLDAPTAVRAMARIAERRRDVKLFFMGTERPNRAVVRMAAVDEAIELSRRLGLAESSVLFNDWVPYTDRQNYLLEADVGINLHRDSAESRLAFRTRLLDYVWAGLPIVASEGDVLAERVRQSGLGKTVGPDDDEAVAAAILELLADPDARTNRRARFAEVGSEYRWPVVARPLVAFCRDPRLAADKGALRIGRWQRRMARIGEFLGDRLGGLRRKRTS